MKIVFVIFLLFSISSFADITRVKRLQWIDPRGRQPITYSEWSKRHTDRGKPTTIGPVYEKIARDRQNLVAIIVNTSIYSNITIEIDTFINDLVIAGYSVQLDTIVGMSHTLLRNHLASLTNLVGAIFVGELPVAWFETNGFGNWEEYPHDLYFSDLDGTYIDADGDGIYDNHTGSVAPEIWVGRIYSRNLIWNNEIRLLKNYFHKNHQYRTVGSSLPQRGLSFVDDDWCYWTTCDLDLIYSNVVVINDEYQTTASNYRNQFSQGYEWIHICAHSSPWGHTFKYYYDEYRGTVFNYEIFTLEPQALFYNLFACSGTRFTEENGSAGWYLFNDPYGLLVVGSTKTGSMLNFEDFYGPIGQQNMCIGEAFKYWFTLWGETDWDWFYGMNVLGDPTLKPMGQIDVASARKKYAPTHRMTDWTSPEIVASDPESDGFPKITTNTDEKIWVVWESGRSYANGRSEIYSAYRDQTGWSSAMNVGPHVYWDYCPDIAIDSLNRPIAVWAGWIDLPGNYQYDILYSVYDGSWSTRQTVAPLDPGFDLKPDLVRDASNRLWVSWESRRDIDLNIYASYFNGSSWSSSQEVTTNSADETTPHMCVDSLGRAWVMYERRFEDRSEIWGSYYTGSQWLESGPISGYQRRAYRPAGAVDDDGTVWVVWQSADGGNPDIYASYFNGTIWSGPIQITTSTGSDLFPDVAIDDSGVVWLVYQSKMDGEWNIYCAYCVDSTWSTPEIVVDLLGADINPRITCSDSNRLWVAWQSYATDNWEITVSHRPDVGIIERKEGYAEYINPNISVSATLFSKSLRIITKQKNQKIKIFDVNGSLIQELSSDENGVIVWSPKNITSGIYFIVIIKQQNSIAQKVLYLK